MSKSKQIFWAMCAALAVVFTIAITLQANIVINGMVIGVFMLFSVGFGYIFLPRWMKCVIMFAPCAFIFDLVASWGLTYAMGYSLTGFTAGIVFGLLLSIVMKFERLRLFDK